MKVYNYDVERLSIEKYTEEGVLQNIHVEFDVCVNPKEFHAIFEMLDTGEILIEGEKDVRL